MTHDGISSLASGPVCWTWRRSLPPAGGAGRCGWGRRRSPRGGPCPLSIPATAVARYQPVLSDVERMTLLGFLAGYRGFTRDAYTLDLRQFTAWCWQHDHRLFDVRRVDIECFGRDLEDRGKARATVARRLCTVAGFYRYAEEKESSTTPRRCTSAGHASTTSPTSHTWTATSSAPSWSPPVCHRHATTRWCRCSR